MSYLLFHLVFIVPPLLLLAAAHLRRTQVFHRRAGLFLIAMTVIALLYTTPWDNYLVWRGIWTYGEDRVLGTIGYVPVEEYLFFILQPLLTGLWLYRILSGHPDGAASAAAERPGSAAVRWAGAAAYILVFFVGLLLLRHESGTYLGLILVWAAPVLAMQWAYAGRAIWARRRSFALGVAVPTLYLWIADAVAIGLGIWQISDRFTLGPAVGPLPLEEAVFFLVTNLLVVQGLLLFLYPPVRPSVREATPAEAAHR